MFADKINISVLDETNEYRKLFKVVPYSSGGFALVLPRLVDLQTGRLEKTLVTYKRYGTHLDIKRDESQQYSASDIVKFSYHPDGFVQFSSATNSRITSGRNPDGTPKGLGLLSWPLNNPISTGPSMTITLWGLDKFAKELPTKVDKRFVFETKEAVKHQKAIFVKDDQTAYAMALYIIPNSISGNVIDKDGKKTANLAMMQALPDGSSFMRLRELVRIIEIPRQSYRIAISWFFIPKKSQSDSGYIFFGPTDGKRGLVASYPAVDYGKKLLMKDLTFNIVSEK
jgi:hypothetical protein